MAHDYGYRIPHDGEPMKLCSICADMTVKKFVDGLEDYGSFKKSEWFEHQPCFTALFASSSSGCEMCALFYDGIIHMYSSTHKCSSEAAHRVFEHVDLQLRGSEKARRCLYETRCSEKRREQ